MIVLDIEQRSPEWFEAKAGIPSASNADKIITPKTGILSAQHDKFISVLIAESLGIRREAKIFNAAMAEGVDREDEALSAYLFERDDASARPVGLILQADGLACCSPDALLNDDSEGLEMKNPDAETHIHYLRYGGLPDEYKPQVHMSLAISGLPVWNFMSYYPGLPPLIVPVEPDAYTQKVREALDEFTARLVDERGKFGISSQLRAAA